MRELWPVAAITFKEGIRSRALYGVALFGLLLLGVNFLVSGMIMREVGKVAVDIALSAVSFGGLMVVLFVGINLLAKDIDKKTIYSVISRPISKSQYIYGKFFGVVLVMLASIAFLAVSATASIWLVKFNFPTYFDRFHWSPVVMSFLMTFLMFVVLIALSFLFNSISSASFITFILTVISYLVGHSVAEVKKLIEAGEALSGGGGTLIESVVNVVYYVFPNLSLFDVKLQAAHSLPVAGSYYAWVTVYGIGYAAVSLLLAALIFRRREFP